MKKYGDLHTLIPAMCIMGKSELDLREALVKRYPRDSFLLADKLPTFSITKAEQLPIIFE